MYTPYHIMFICMYVCVHVCMYVCVCVCMIQLTSTLKFGALSKCLPHLRNELFAAIYDGNTLIHSYIHMYLCEYVNA